LQKYQQRHTLHKRIKMSLNIPNAPNAQLFKQGYQKYNPLQFCFEKSAADFSTATILKMELF